VAVAHRLQSEEPRDHALGSPYSGGALMNNTQLVRTLQAVRDATEDHLKELDQGHLRLVRMAATGADVDVTREQIALLSSLVRELNRVLAHAHITKP
jgi:hypothetical protein